MGALLRGGPWSASGGPRLARAGSTPRRQRQAGAEFLIEEEDMDGELGLTPLGDHLAAPRGRGRLRGAPHAGTAGGAPCGDTVRLAVAVDGGSVVDAGFDARGCAAAVAAAS